jgi:hypothetical protein
VTPVACQRDQESRSEPAGFLALSVRIEADHARATEESSTLSTPPVPRWTRGPDSWLCACHPRIRVAGADRRPNRRRCRPRTSWSHGLATGHVRDGARRSAAGRGPDDSSAGASGSTAGRNSDSESHPAAEAERDRTARRPAAPPEQKRHAVRRRVRKGRTPTNAQAARDVQADTQSSAQAGAAARRAGRPLVADDAGIGRRRKSARHGRRCPAWVDHRDARLVAPGIVRLDAGGNGTRTVRFAWSDRRPDPCSGNEYDADRALRIAVHLRDPP